jgi:hypothetical protein
MFANLLPESLKLWQSVLQFARLSNATFADVHRSKNDFLRESHRPTVKRHTHLLPLIALVELLKKQCHGVSPQYGGGQHMYKSGNYCQAEQLCTT